MSQMTENTLVIKNEYIGKLKEVIKKDDSSSLSFYDFVLIYQNETITIFIFDCNGNPLCIDENIEYEILETNYLDGEEYWTQTREGDTDKTAVELLKDIVPEVDYIFLPQQLEYSI